MSFMQGLRNFGQQLNSPEFARGLLSNPLFNAGMGLLASYNDPSINPYQAMLGGLTQSQRQATQQEEQERERQLRERLSSMMTPPNPGMATPGFAPPEVTGPLAPEGGGTPEQMFGLLAEYGDPQRAAQGLMNYRLAQQRMEQQASQTRTQGFDEIVDEEGRIWFPSSTAQGGVIPATDSEGNQLKAPSALTYQKDAAGNIYALPKRTGLGGAPTPQTVIDSQTVEQDIQTRADLAKQSEKRRGLMALEDNFVRPGGSWDLVNRMLSPEMKDTRELMSGKSSMLGVPMSFIPGTDAANWRAMQGQLKDQAFMQGIINMRQSGASLGQITEREGLKVEKSYLNLVNASTDEQFLRALNDFKDAQASFIKTARKEAGLDPLAPSVEGAVDLRSRSQRAADQPAMSTNRVDELRRKYLGGQ